MSSSGQYFQYTWSWATSCSFGRTSEGLVAVIDGGRIFSCLVMGVGLWVGLLEMELSIYYDHNHLYSHLAYLKT